MKKTLLPFEYEPYAKMYNEHGFVFGMIQGNADQDITPWFCGKFINCWFDPTSPNKFEYNVFDTSATEDKILINQFMYLYPEQIKLLFGGDILTLFRDMLDMGLYPRGRYNEEHIPGKWAYGNAYFNHDFILVGYDDEAKCFISAGYLSDGKFQKYLIPYENMDAAIKTNKPPNSYFGFWKYNQNAVYKLNIPRIIDQLDDYIKSTTKMSVYLENKTWGLQAISDLRKHFEKCGEKKRYLDVRYTRGIMEHKFFMEMRIEYLLNHGYLVDNFLLNSAKEVNKMAQLIHFLAIKYNITGEISIANRICETLNKMIDIERKYLPSVLSQLQAKSEDIIA